MQHGGQAVCKEADAEYQDGIEGDAGQLDSVQDPLGNMSHGQTYGHAHNQLDNQPQKPRQKH